MRKLFPYLCFFAAAAFVFSCNDDEPKIEDQPTQEEPTPEDPDSEDPDDTENPEEPGQDDPATEPEDSAVAVMYTIKVKSNNDAQGIAFIGSEGITSVEVEEGGSVELTAVPAKGFRFKEWSYILHSNKHFDADSVFVYNDIEQNMTFTANFEVIPEEEVPDTSGYIEDGTYTIIFEDDFDQSSSTPDQQKWMLCPKGTSAWNKHMSQSYDQAYVKDGNLVLVGELVDGVYKAGGIRMLNDLGFQYGKVEVRARFTVMAQGSWPAIWMMPSKPRWNGWPLGGEIDIMEHLNKDANVWNVIHSHWVDNLGNRSNPPYSATPRVNTDDYNTYGIEWTPYTIDFYVNGSKTLSYRNLNLSDNNIVKQWPFDAPFYLILNNALGGPGTWPGAINDNQLPSIFEIDYVKVWQKQ